MCQGKLRTRSWVSLEAFSAGIRGIFGVEVERGRFQRFAEVRQAFLKLIRPHRFLPPVFLIFTTEGKHLRGSRGRRRCDHYLLKSCFPAINADSTLTGSNDSLSTFTHAVKKSSSYGIEEFGGRGEGVPRPPMHRLAGP